jgi:hypothetical protein
MSEERKIIRREEPVKQESYIDVLAEQKGESLMEFVEKQINLMNNRLLFNGNREPSLYEINVALSTYEQTLLGLQVLYEQAKFDSEVAKAKYEEFYNVKYMEIRNTYNTKDVKNAQWLSGKEIEATLYKVYQKDLSELKLSMIEAEGKRSTMQRLCDSWNSYLWCLNTLSKNSIAAANASISSIDMTRGDETDI